MLGPSEGALSGASWVSMNTAAIPRLTAARASTGANSRWGSHPRKAAFDEAFEELVEAIDDAVSNKGADATTAMPRAWLTFDALRGYDDLPPERHGTPAQPDPSELGMLLVMRMFRNVCLGLERGAALDSVMPPGFAAHASGPYLFGADAPAGSNTRILSATGSAERDETEGRPTVSLRPARTGMSCAIEWYVPQGMEPNHAQALALVVRDWLPYRMALVRASPPALSAAPPPSDVIEWDRPCADAWCPVTAIYTLSDILVRLETRLTITDIGGNRP